MKKLKRSLCILLACLLTASLAACATSGNGQESGQQDKTISFGAVGSVELIPVIIAQEKGYFKEQGVNVNIQSFKSSKDRDAAFQSGNLDGIVCDEVAICLYQNGGFDVKITGATDGNFMLIAGKDSGIQSVGDLKSKSVAISEKTCIEYTLDTLLVKNGMTAQDVEKSVVPAIPTRLEMLRARNVDAALLPEPFSTMALQDGGILLGSAKDDGIYTSVTAFTQKSIDQKGASIQAFYRAYNQAVDYINSTPVSEYEDTIIRTVGYPADMKGKIQLPKFSRNALPAESDVQAVMDWSAQKKLLTKSLTPKDVMSDMGTK
jgi:NitT/TauT family transport system substrate-binding protein